MEEESGPLRGWQGGRLRVSHQVLVWDQELAFNFSKCERRLNSGGWESPSPNPHSSVPYRVRRAL
jgi:hypothetical protein